MTPVFARRLLEVGLLLLGTGAGLQLVASRSPASVERIFSGRLYVLGAHLGCLTAVFPFSVAELLVPVLLGGLLYRLRRISWRGRLGIAVAMAGGAYLVFLLCWGLNYQRQPFGFTARFDTRPADLPELVALCSAAVDEANQSRRALAEDAHGIMKLGDGRRGALARAGAGFREAGKHHPTLDGSCARPKPLLSSALFSRLGITGLYFPFTAEANVNVDAPDPEVPFSASHELAHARGYAREDEANYIGYLACRLHPDPDFQYSGRLAASLYALSALGHMDRAARERLEERRSPAVRRDVAALEAWAERHRGRVQEASRRVNDAYLRSQGQIEGVRSYGRMVDLLLAERRPRR